MVIRTSLDDHGNNSVHRGRAHTLASRLSCNGWEQASHGGEVAAAVAQGQLTRDDVTELGRVLADELDGRSSDEEITLFDSTGLAIQDLAVARAAFAKAGELDLQRLEI
jgi:ornithine cyclodeaminase/alanine dehydrogenase-like protein (mu-crystallin family)